MRTHGWVRPTAVAGVAALLVGLTLGVAMRAQAASNPTATLAAVQGITAVTRGGNAAYTTTISTGGDTLTHLSFHDVIPTNSTGAQATLKSASCTGTLTATEFVCDPIDLHSGDVATVTIVWQTFATGTSAGCTADCIRNSGYWTSDSGTNAPDKKKKTYPVGPVDLSILSVNDANAAASYVLSACSNPSTPTIATNQSIGPGNPLSTAVCEPNLPATTLGLVSNIDERAGTPSEQGITQVSDICIPAPGAGCASGYTPFVFSTKATFTFKIDNTALPQVCTSSFRGASGMQPLWHQPPPPPHCSLAMITKVYHDNVLVSSASGADPRVVTITFNSSTKITTVVAQSSTNGGWRFG